MQLEDRFYTSTEVAEILGVSLRSVYRYLEEDKLHADVKTATGRHRFTKQNILDFLYPSGKPPVNVELETPYVAPGVEERQPQEVIKAVEVTEEATMGDAVMQEEPQVPQEPVAEPEEEVDWLSKFKEAAEKHRVRMAQEEQMAATMQDTAPVQPVVSAFEPVSPVQQPMQATQATVTHPTSSLSSLTTDDLQAETMPERGATTYYYKSNVGGLKELAQYINKTARKSNVPYAFTMNAGMSLHKLIRPFSILHVYVRNDDRDFFEKALELTPSDQNTAQLCLYIGDQKVMNESKEIHGLYVVSDAQLRKDLLDGGEVDLAGELEEVLNL